jgi:hypothetical protein
MKPTPPRIQLVKEGGNIAIALPLVVAVALFIILLFTM